MRIGALPFGLACVLALSTAGCEDVLGGLGTGGARGDAPADNTPPGTSAQIDAMQAIAQLVVDPDGSAVAQLNVLTTDNGATAALTGVSDAYVALGEDRRSLPTTAFVGTFGLATSGGGTLSPERDEPVTFGYVVTDEAGAVTEVFATASLPSDPLVAELPQTLIAFANEPLDIELLGWGDGGWAQVYTADGTLTYSTIDPSIASAEASLAAVQAVGPPFVRLPRGAFPEPGTYRIELVSFGISDRTGDGLSNALGSWSWVGVGERVALSYTVE